MSTVAQEEFVFSPYEFVIVLSGAASQVWGMKKVGIAALKGFAWIIVLGFAAWAFGAIRYDFPWGRGLVSWLFLIVIVAGMFFLRVLWKKLAAVLLLCLLVLGWWFSLHPSNDRSWIACHAETAWAEVAGDEVTVHHVRNFDYHAGNSNPQPRWESRTVDLTKLTGVDIFINQWGSPMMAHPIVSFQFADAPPLCFSIETRKEIGEGYSAIGGIYRQFELIYIVADERDVIRVRTNLTGGETTRLYRTSFGAVAARKRFLEYIGSLNLLRQHPRWYNAVTTNCTTSIRAQHPAHERSKWDWRILINGSLDELLYEYGAIRSDDLPLAELKARALINPVAQAVDRDPEFSERIREGRPGFHK